MTAADRCRPAHLPDLLLLPAGSVGLLMRRLVVVAAAGGFTPDNPFPSRYGDYSPGPSPKHRAFGAPNLHTATPLPGTGLPLVGMADMGHHRRQLELQELAQQSAAARTQAAATAAVVMVAQS